jgi:flagellar hook-length control protein FliK
LAQTAYQGVQPAPINLPQMAYEIVRHVQQGQSHFEIRLDPADMGRVDVKLAIDSSGAVNARLTVERPETLDLLRRDAGQLGQALTQAGLDAGKTNLQFSLSQNPFARQESGTPGGGGFASTADADDDANDTLSPVAGATTVYRGSVAASGLNLFV